LADSTGNILENKSLI